MNKSYFIQAFVIILLATLFFLGLKEILPKRIFPEIATDNPNMVIDSLLLEAIWEEENFTTFQKQETDTVLVIAEKEKVIEEFQQPNSQEHLTLFFEKLAKLEEDKKGKIRIGYFGDSMTDGDYIVQDLRRFFQDEFSGKGIGFVSITSESAASRGSIKHSYSDNWQAQSYVNTKKPIRPFGVNGHVFFVNDSANATWVEYKASYQKNVSQLYNPTLFYGGSDNQEAYVELFYNGDTTRVVKPLNTDKKLNTLRLADKNLISIKMNFVNADSIAFYGINSAEDSGVYIDNFSSRGNSGLPLSLLNPSFIKEFDQELGGYDLIVLHYGTNVLNYGNLNYSWYERSMTRVVNHLKTCFPNASFLIVSTADKSTKYGMEMKTDSAVVPLANAQQRYAETTRSGFINLYTLMGGDGSMVRWVEDEPTLGNKDYTHFNTKGSQKIARFIFDELKKEYAQFRKKKPILNIE
ncbi:MAG: hypothetical protein AB7D46_03985 [Flavobacteriaceae bacterium]